MTVLSRMWRVIRHSAVYIQHSRTLQVAVVFASMCGFGKIWSVFARRRMEEAEGAKALKDDKGFPSKTDEFDFLNFKTLKDFNYEFNQDGQLVNIRTGAGFEFKVSEDHKYNQKRYETIGEIITEHVYGLLEDKDKGGLQRLHVPLDTDKADQEEDMAEQEEAKSFIFVSDDYETNSDKLMILIHGSGVVRAGQWARRLIINDDLDKGTQLPFIKRAKEEGYAVMVLNTNLNKATVDGKEVTIRENGTPERHGLYVWDKIVSTLPAKNIAIVAHSYGGIVTTAMAANRAADFEKRVFAIAFTDSVHSLEWQKVPESITKLYHRRAKNWVTSDEPLDKPVRQPRNDAPRVSAGHEKHEWTSCTAMPSIFTFFSHKYSEFTKSEL